MAMAVAMGANTIRSTTLGVSVGNAKSVWPAANQPNEAAFQAIDYAIMAANRYGLRLVIPLTDEYQVRRRLGLASPPLTRRTVLPVHFSL
jgi:uncharacterized protein YggE